MWGDISAATFGTTHCKLFWLSCNFTLAVVTAITSLLMMPTDSTRGRSLLVLPVSPSRLLTYIAPKARSSSLTIRLRPSIAISVCFIAWSTAFGSAREDFHTYYKIRAKSHRESLVNLHPKRQLVWPGKDTTVPRFILISINFNTKVLTLIIATAGPSLDSTSVRGPMTRLLRIL